MTRSVVVEAPFCNKCAAAALEEPIVTVAESRSLTIGSRVYWQGNSADGGSITGTSWDAVMIAWDNGQAATVHHGDMREIARSPAKPIIVQRQP